MKSLFAALILIFFFVSCAKTEAGSIVDKAIENSGGHNMEGKTIQLNFRGKQYVSTRKDGVFRLERIITDTTGTTIRDVVNNDGFKRFVNDELTSVADTMANKYSNSINSVHYFAYLPFGLNDASVNKELIGQTAIKGKEYYKIKVWFNQEGGGDDFEDIYVYWIDKKTFFVDYLAYEFHVDEGGMRFRQAYNPRDVEGIRFVDYNNFKPKDEKVSIYALDSLFKLDELQLLSKIELQNVTVQECTDC